MAGQRRALLLAVLLSAPLWGADYFLYAGTYTNKSSKGIYAWRFLPDSGKLTAIGLVAETPDPSYLVVHPNRRFLYAVNETPKGAITAFAIDQATGKLTVLNTVSSRGSGPCHLTLDSSGKTLVVANYDTGSVASFPIATDGRLGEAASFFQNSGSSVNQERQKGPHAHCAVVSPDNRYALIADLGLDQILVYRLNAEKLAPNDPPFAKTVPGAGPRHLAFHPDGRRLYAINELASTVTAYAYDRARGALRETQTISTLPGDFHGSNTTAEIAVHSSGKFLYGSNRGHDSIAVFAIDPAAGKLTLTQNISTQGKVPRNFAIDPAGNYLLAANQNSDNIVVFRIDRATGRLTATGETAQAPTPVSLTFVSGH